MPVEEAFDSFAGGESFRALRERHGLPEPTSVEDFPVHLVLVDGERV